MDAQKEALCKNDMKEFEHQCYEYGRYCEVFSRALGISEECFNSLVIDFIEEQSKSE